MSNVRPSCPQDPDVVEAWVLEEPRIFGRDDGLGEHFRNVRQWRHDATFNEELADELLIAGIDLGD